MPAPAPAGQAALFQDSALAAPVPEGKRALSKDNAPPLAQRDRSLMAPRLRTEEISVPSELTKGDGSVIKAGLTHVRSMTRFYSLVDGTLCRYAWDMTVSEDGWTLAQTVTFAFIAACLPDVENGLMEKSVFEIIAAVLGRPLNALQVNHMRLMSCFRSLDTEVHGKADPLLLEGIALPDVRAVVADCALAAGDVIFLVRNKHPSLKLGDRSMRKVNYLVTSMRQIAQAPKVAKAREAEAAVKAPRPYPVADSDSSDDTSSGRDYTEQLAGVLPKEDKRSWTKQLPPTKAIKRRRTTHSIPSGMWQDRRLPRDQERIVYFAEDGAPASDVPYQLFELLASESPNWDTVFDFGPTCEGPLVETRWPLNESMVNGVMRSLPWDTKVHYTSSTKHVLSLVFSLLYAAFPLLPSTAGEAFRILDTEADSAVRFFQNQQLRPKAFRCNKTTTSIPNRARLVAATLAPAWACIRAIAPDDEARSKTLASARSRIVTVFAAGLGVRLATPAPQTSDVIPPLPLSGADSDGGDEESADDGATPPSGGNKEGDVQDATQTEEQTEATELQTEQTEPMEVAASPSASDSSLASSGSVSADAVETQHIQPLSTRPRNSIGLVPPPPAVPYSPKSFLGQPAPRSPKGEASKPSSPQKVRPAVVSDSEDSEDE